MPREPAIEGECQDSMPGTLNRFEGESTLGAGASGKSTTSGSSGSKTLAIKKKSQRLGEIPIEKGKLIYITS
jgi:hypothetical protein